MYSYSGLKSSHISIRRNVCSTFRPKGVILEYLRTCEVEKQIIYGIYTYADPHIAVTLQTRGKYQPKTATGQLRTLVHYLGTRPDIALNHLLSPVLSSANFHVNSGPETVTSRLPRDSTRTQTTKSRSEIIE